METISLYIGSRNWRVMVMVTNGKKETNSTLQLRTIWSNQLIMINTLQDVSMCLSSLYLNSLMWSNFHTFHISLSDLVFLQVPQFLIINGELSVTTKKWSQATLFKNILYSFWYSLPSVTTLKKWCLINFWSKVLSMWGSVSGLGDCIR